MSNSNIDNLVLKFAMSRFKAGAVVPPMAYQPSPLATPIETPEQQRLYESTVSTAPRLPGPAGYDQNGFFANTGTVNPDGSLNTTQFNTQGPYSGIDPSSSAFYDMPIAGDRGVGLGGMGITGLGAGLGTYAALKAMGNREFANIRGLDLADPRVTNQQRMEILARNLLPDATSASVTRVGVGGGTTPLVGAGVRAMSQTPGAIPPQNTIPGEKAVRAVPAKPATRTTPATPAVPATPSTLATTNTGGLVLNQTGSGRAIPGIRGLSGTRTTSAPLKAPGLFTGAGPRPGSPGSNFATQNAGRVATGVGAATALATYLANQADTDRQAPGMNEGVAGYIPTAPASTQDRTIPAR